MNYPTITSRRNVQKWCGFRRTTMLSTHMLLYCLLAAVLTTVLISFITLEMKNAASFSRNVTEKNSAKTCIASTMRGKSNNPYRCYNDTQSSRLSDFYRLDCENPFLRNLSLRSFGVKSDICEPFNDVYDGNDNPSLYSRIETEFEHFRHNITYDDIVYMGSACAECHHLQIIEGQLFVVERRTAANFQTRSRSIKTLFKQVVDTFAPLGDIEIFIHTRE